MNHKIIDLAYVALSLEDVLSLLNSGTWALYHEQIVNF